MLVKKTGVRMTGADTSYSRYGIYTAIKMSGQVDLLQSKAIRAYLNRREQPSDKTYARHSRRYSKVTNSNHQ